ncbi:MAG: 2-amino-4-hydroxy-6-hydroxymethyldihydropteridine diphosphokinase [Actinomycetota bacterium]
MAARAFLGLGSNLGDRLANLQRAVDLLAATPDVSVLRSSRIYETSPIGPAQPDFLNAVVEVDTALEPGELLTTCAAVEEVLQRVRGIRWGPRTLDVDLLTFDDAVIETDDLVVPHPRMHERAFVLVPLLELNDDPPLPGGRRARDLSTDGWADGVRLFASPLRVS